MSLEMAREWLRSARLDLDSIEYILDAEHLTSIAAFHSQQAVEKCFKSILEYKEHKVPKTHDVLSLYNTIKKIFFIDINEDMLDKLNALYVDARYPGEFGLLPDGKPTIVEAKEFYEFAKYVYNVVTKYLSD